MRRALISRAQWTFETERLSSKISYFRRDNGSDATWFRGPAWKFGADAGLESSRRRLRSVAQRTGKAIFEARHADDMGNRLAVIGERQQQPFKKERSPFPQIEIGVFIGGLGRPDAAAICAFFSSEDFGFGEFDFPPLAAQRQAFGQRFSDRYETHPGRLRLVVDAGDDEIVLPPD